MQRTWPPSSPERVIRRGRRSVGPDGPFSSVLHGEFLTVERKGTPAHGVLVAVKGVGGGGGDETMKAAEDSTAQAKVRRKPGVQASAEELQSRARPPERGRAGCVEQQSFRRPAVAPPPSSTPPP